MHRRSTLLATVAVATSLTTLAACSGGSPTTAARTRTPSPSPTSASPSPSPSPTPTPVAGAWLTGQAGPAGPVVVIKVDNAASARPLQHGLARAQVVYQELVEGGTTRYAAVYVGPSNVDVGPVRSARDTDVELFAQYGRPIFGFSGANSGVMAHVQASPLVAVSQYAYDGAYDKRGRRVEAYNFYTTPSRLISAAKPRTGSPLRDVGFRFGDAPPGGQVVSGTLTVPFSRESVDHIGWDASAGAWHISCGSWTVQGTDGKPVAPDNILIQFVPLASGRYVDVDGNRSPDSITVGRGRAVLLRDGHRYEGTWERSTAGGPTRWVHQSGHTLALKPGRTWVLLVPAGTNIG